MGDCGGWFGDCRGIPDSQKERWLMDAVSSDGISHIHQPHLSNAYSEGLWVNNESLVSRLALKMVLQDRDVN